MCIVCAMIMMKVVKVMIMKFLQMLGWRRGIWRAQHCPGLALSINTLYHYHWKYHYRWKYHFIFEPTIDHFGPRVPCCLILGHIGPVGKFLATQALIVILSPIFQHGILPRLKTLMKMMVCTAGHLLVGTKALNRRGGAEEQGALRRRREPLHDQFWHLVPTESLPVSTKFSIFNSGPNWGIAHTSGKHLERNAPQWGNYWHQDWLLGSGVTWNLKLDPWVVVMYFISKFFDWLTKHFSLLGPQQMPESLWKYKLQDKKGTRKLWCSAVDEQLKSMFGLS